ncbi:Alcohol dehydrogenase, class IV [Thermodesulfobium acidiphilum]|uniref:Alcohol dehydrogenase, class IV n=1 Tax=Thermodesulfobium acidiphilum TaxID=1794699 RepID=A0A2R4W1G3_THEAF|nr:iron-containing alcohol dehydrogenase [Thermodesulfobium acidiphilum]AWB10625.1 Alcohol dehydrogenase, class IV [Thermodesulfobium acidiphilum]
MSKNESMYKISKFAAPEFIFGIDSIDYVKRYIKNFSLTHPMVVTDSGLLSASWAKNIFKQLEGIDIRYSIYDKVSENPKDYEVEEISKVIINCNCDSIIAIGGGSVIDAAKAGGIMCANPGSIRDYEGIDKIVHPMPPIICVPTTCGSSADVSQFAIITNTDERYKMAIVSKSLLPDISIIDPKTLTTLPKELLIATSLDALTHAFESYVSLGSSPITDMFALKAIRLIFETLPKVAKDPKNINYLEDLMLASLMAGMAFSNASLGMVHAIAHSMGGYKDIRHGTCNAILLDSVIDFNYVYAAYRYDKISESLGYVLEDLNEIDRKKILIESIMNLKNKIGFNITLKDLQIKESEIDIIAKHAVNDPCMLTNPVMPTFEEVKEFIARNI